MSDLQPALQRSQIALDNLEAGSVVLDRFGHAWQSARGYGALGTTYATGYWYRSYGDDSEVSTFELAQKGPFHLMAADKTPLHRKRKVK